MNDKTKPILDTRTCLIIDATYSPYVEEDLDTDVDETPFSEYGNSVVLLLQDVDTFNVFHCPLSASNVQELANLSREPTPRQLIAFASALRSRNAPVTLLVAADSNLVTPDMIKELQANGLLNNQEAMDKYNAAKAKQEEIVNEQESIPESEYEQFMSEQDNQLLGKFQEWKKEKEMASRQSVFLELDNIEEEELDTPKRRKNERTN